jgi:hypothetical protein
VLLTIVSVIDKKYLLKDSEIILVLAHILSDALKLGIASWYAFLPDKDLTMFQVVLVLFLEFIMNLYGRLASIIFLVNALQNVL